MEQFFNNIAPFYLAAARWLLPAAALLFLIWWVRCLRWRAADPVPRAALVTKDGARLIVPKKEALFGRSRSCDVEVPDPKLSRRHAYLLYYNDRWHIRPYRDGCFLTVNGTELTRLRQLSYGDVIGAGAEEYTFDRKSDDDEIVTLHRRPPKEPKYASQSVMLLWLTVFQWLLCAEILCNAPARVLPAAPICFIVLSLLEWSYYLIMEKVRLCTVLSIFPAFFLTSVGFAVCASSAPDELYKQLIAVLCGFAGYLFIRYLLPKEALCERLKIPAAGAAILLLLICLLFGNAIFGAKNWINLGFVSVQPSEFVKFLLIFIGAAGICEMQKHLSSWIFLGFAGACMLLLALMVDFGAVLIFFVVTITILIVRMTDWRIIGGVFGVAAVGGGLLVAVKPHILSRFSVWRHIWEYPHSTGFQQTRTLIAMASGGLLGLGACRGNLYTIPAADTDLVFGMVWEELGGMIALCVFACFLLWAWSAWRSAANGAPARVTSAVCGTAALFLFQTCLNFFGSTDIVPLTGVTVPFVSNGGSSTVACFLMLAFFTLGDREADEV